MGVVSPVRVDAVCLCVLTRCACVCVCVCVCVCLCRYLMSQEMRASANHLAITVVRSYTVWALTFCFLIVSAIMSTAFFQNVENDDPDAPQFQEGLGRAFQDFRSSFLSMCVVLCAVGGRCCGTCSCAHAWVSFAAPVAVAAAGSFLCAPPPTSRKW